LQPELLWDGATAVAPRIKILAEEYNEVYNERAEPKLELIHAFQGHDEKLWRDLAPYRRKLPPVRVVVFSYPGSEEAVVLPKTILLAVGAWRFTRDDLADAILSGMHSLAEGGQAS